MSTSHRRVLVLGGTGMLGHKLVQVMAATPGLDVHVTVRTDVPSVFHAFEVTCHRSGEVRFGHNALADILTRLAPDVVVNAIGVIKQREPTGAEETYYVNTVLPHLVGHWNPNPDARLIHISTDCVFRGDRGHYVEADSPDAEDVYGRSKASGEVTYGRHLTLRTSIIGPELSSRRGLLSWLLSRPAGERVPGYSNAIFSGLTTLALGETIVNLILRLPDVHGLYHVASEAISKHDLLVRLRDAFDLDVAIAPSATPVIDRSLDDSAFRRATGIARPDWSSLVPQLAADVLSGPFSEYYTPFQAGS